MRDMRELLKIAFSLLNKKYWKDNKEFSTSLDLVVKNIDQIEDADVDVVREIYKILCRIDGKVYSNSIEEAFKLITSLNTKYGFKKDDPQDSITISPELTSMLNSGVDSQKKESVETQEHAESNQSSRGLKEKYDDLNLELANLRIEYNSILKIIEVYAPINIPQLFVTTENTIGFLLEIVKEILDKDPNSIAAEIRMKSIETLINTMYSFLGARKQPDIVKYNDILCDQLAAIAPYIEAEKYVRKYAKEDNPQSELEENNPQSDLKKEYERVYMDFEFIEYDKIFFDRDMKDLIPADIDIDSIYAVTHDAIGFLLESIKDNLSVDSNDMDVVSEMGKIKLLIKTLICLLSTRKQNDFVKFKSFLSDQMLNLCATNKSLGTYLEEKVKNRQKRGR